MALKVAGRNNRGELVATPNNEDNYGNEVISPPINVPLKISTLLSFSVYNDHSVWVTKEGKAFTMGYNDQGKICGLLPIGETFSTQTQIELKDSENNSYLFTSAVCNYASTLYMCHKEGQQEELVFFSYGMNQGQPLFLDLDGHHPVALYGGEERSACIDEEGAVFVVSRLCFSSPRPPRIVLPNNLKVVYICCCDDFLVVLANDGHLYYNGELIGHDQTDPTSFVEVDEVKDLKFLSCSGCVRHVLAVSEDGRVFSIGENEDGQLGVGKDSEDLDQFTEITSLASKHIVAVYAGSCHSLFQTDQGQIIACGGNTDGQLMLSEGPTPSIWPNPKDTLIKSDARFCIAGYGQSGVFVRIDPPPFCPNKKLQ